MGEKENNNSLNESPVARWLRNAVLGATMADLPAMMTASGWRLNEKGDYVLDLQNDPRVKLLRDNLAAEGAGVMLGEFGIPAVYGLYNLGLRGLGKAGSNYARAKLISREMQNASTSNHTYSLNVGWGPKQTIKVTHATDSLEPLQLFFDKRWDVTHEGANPFGVWYLGKWGLPRTATTNSLPGKAEKAEKARKVFADRKYKHEGDLTLDKPMTTVGEVPDRSVLSREAEKMGADGIVYNNVYDNGFDNNLVILSFKTPEKTSINVVKENAHKLSDPEWDQIYEAALKEGDTKKLKELRALHFQVKSGNDPQVFAHSTNNTFNQFDKSFFGLTDEGFNGSGFYFTTTRVPENQAIFKIAKGPNGEIPYMNYGRNKKYFYIKGDREYNVGDPSRNFFEEENTVGFVSPKDSKVSEVVVGLPTLVKNTRTITYDDNGNFIPLSKRDDFTNPDFRYKNGGLVKKHLLGGLVEAGTSFIPIAGTYQSYQDYKKDPSWSNLGWTLASGVGDVLQLTGLGYGIGSAIKGLKAANAARKSVQAVNNVRRATRMANQAKMLEYGETGKRGFQGWKAAGINLRNSDKKLEAATLVLKGEALQQAKNAGKGFTAAFTDPVDWAETIYKNKDGLQ